MKERLLTYNNIKEVNNRLIKINMTAPNTQSKAKLTIHTKQLLKKRKELVRNDIRNSVE